MRDWGESQSGIQNSIGGGATNNMSINLNVHIHLPTNAEEINQTALEQALQPVRQLLAMFKSDKEIEPALEIKELAK